VSDPHFAAPFFGPRPVQRGSLATRLHVSSCFVRPAEQCIALYVSSERDIGHDRARREIVERAATSARSHARTASRT